MAWKIAFCAVGEITRDFERMNIPVPFPGSLFEGGEAKDVLGPVAAL